LRTSVEDITEYYRQQGICSGQDCVRFMQQVGRISLKVLEHWYCNHFVITAIMG